MDTIEFYLRGSEIQSVTADGKDHSIRSKEGKRLRDLCYPDRNGNNPGLYKCVESLSGYSKFEKIKS